ncbi:hypothetical protein TWF696_006535 [Orbilia brochopaga]|uniref:Uncharacterized protein n=1 Tax=Orbilia brochopaga TaxID=3140254 RepID=A0AAV9UXF9_9PEZI
MSSQSFNSIVNTIGFARFLSCVSTILLIAQPVCADPGDDFSNNLFSDLAPLLALFGEQVAKQFLSQSLSWLDSVIFAMAPLGIITAIVSAIRVGGPRWLRAVIGRARESKGEAELELMSSTSADVCELWNGETIVRTLGSPYITEVLWLEKTDASESSPDDDAAAQESLLSSTDQEYGDKTWYRLSGVVYSLADAERAKLIKTKQSEFEVKNLQGLSVTQLFDHGVFELEAPGAIGLNYLESSHNPDPERPKPALNLSKVPPNLSLNVSGEPTSMLELAAVAICSTILQAGVIAFEIIITYLRPFNQRFEKEGQPVGAYACPLTVAGTCLVVLGMFICCKVVQERSKEEVWDFDKINIPAGYRLKVAWLQRHQVVTDQNFGAFCLYAPPNRHQIMSSWFNTNRKSQNVLTLVGTVISVIGFVVQFTGLRGMHYSATLAQLAATLVVALLRIMIRRQLGNRPILEAVPDGQELDWMARKTTKCSKWVVKPLSPANPPDGEDLGTFSARCRLREICPWPLEDSSISSTAESLARSFEEITNYVYSSDIKLIDEAQNIVSFEIPIHIAYSRRGSKDSHGAVITLTMYRDVVSDDRNSSWTGWKTDRSAIEAILTLWRLNLAEDEEQPDTGYNDRDKSIILLGPSSDFRILDYDLFIGQSNRCLHMKGGMDDLQTGRFPVPEHRVFGYMGPDPNAEHLALVSFSYLPDLCARHILTCYFYRLCQFIHTLNGQTTVLRSTQFNINNSALRLNNTHLDNIGDLLHSNGVHGTREDFFMILVPALQKNGNLLRVTDAFSMIVREARDAEANGQQPPISKDMLFHMADNALKTFRSNSYWLYAGDFVFGLLETCQLVLGDDHEWTQAARVLACRACHSIEAQLFCEVEFQDNDGLKVLSGVCQSLSSQCDRVLGKESFESQILSRLYFRARGSVTTNVVELPGTIATLAEVSPIQTPRGQGTSSPVSPISISSTSTLPGNITNTALEPGINIDDPVMKEVRSFRPSLDFSLIKSFPRKAWAHVKQQNLASLYALLKPKQQRLAPEEIILISHTFIIGAACGYSRVVGLCLTKFRDICCHPIGGIGTGFAVAISFATMNNDPVMVDLILSTLDRDQIALLDDIRGADDYVSLQIASREGFVDIAHLLLRAGVSPSGPGVVQDSAVLPLYLAARSNSTAIISLLIFYGAIPTYQDFLSGETFLHYAFRSGAEETINYVLSPDANLASLFLLQDSDGNNALDSAIIYGHDQAAIQLFNTMIAFPDFDILEHRNISGKTPLHLACEYDRANLVNIFLANGFKPDRTMYYPHTAFEAAAIFGSCGVGAVLFEADSNGTILPLDNGPSPIILAARNNKTNYVDFLLEHGAPINAIEQGSEMTPIMIAAWNANAELFDLLLAKGADIDGGDMIGHTVAHFAALSNSAVCLKSLFKSIPDSQKASQLLFMKRRLGEENFYVRQVDGPQGPRFEHFRRRARGDEAETPFQLALWRGNLAAATALFEEASVLKKTRLNLTLSTGEGMTALHSICSLFALEVDETATLTTPPKIKSALQQYVKDTITAVQPGTAIPSLAQRLIKNWSPQKQDEAMELLKLIVAEDVVSSTIPDSHGLTALLYAAVGGHVEACKLLLDHEHNISIPKLQKVLHAALYTGDTEIIKLIVAAGTNLVKAPEYTGHASIGSLLNPACMRLLKLAGKTRDNASTSATGDTLLIDTAEGLTRGPWESDVELLACLQIFIDAGADVSTVEPGQWALEETLLHAAIHCKSPEVIDLLVAAGADVKTAEEAPRSLLHYALAEDPSYVAVVRTLRRNGLDINCVDKEGNTALTIEIEMRRLATVTVLLEGGATIRTVGPWPDLACAANHGNIHILRLLCYRYKGTYASNYDEYTTFLNGTSFPQWPTVHVAAKAGSEDMLAFLSEEGADLSVLNDQGYNAIVCALKQSDAMRFLVSAGLDPNHRQKELGSTAAHVAVQTLESADEVVEALRTLNELGADLNLTDQAGMKPVDYCTAGSQTSGWMADDSMRQTVLDEFDCLANIKDLMSSLEFNRF